MGPVALPHQLLSASRLYPGRDAAGHSVPPRLVGIERRGSILYGTKRSVRHRIHCGWSWPRAADEPMVCWTHRWRKGDSNPRSRSRERARCLGVRPAEGKFVRTNFGRGVIAVSSVCCGRPPSEGLGADLGYAGCRVARHAAAPPSGDTIIDSQARHSRIARTPAPDRQDVAL